MLLLLFLTNGAGWEFTIVEILLYMCTVLIDKVGWHQRVVLGTHDLLPYRVKDILYKCYKYCVLRYHTTVYIWNLGDKKMFISFLHSVGKDFATLVANRPLLTVQATNYLIRLLAHHEMMTDELDKEWSMLRRIQTSQCIHPLIHDVWDKRFSSTHTIILTMLIFPVCNDNVHKEGTQLLFALWQCTLLHNELNYYNVLHCVCVATQYQSRQRGMQWTANWRYTKNTLKKCST